MTTRAQTPEPTRWRRSAMTTSGSNSRSISKPRSRDGAVADRPAALTASSTGTPSTGSAYYRNLDHCDRRRTSSSLDRGTTWWATPRRVEQHDRWRALVRVSVLRPSRRRRRGLGRRLLDWTEERRLAAGGRRPAGGVALDRPARLTTFNHDGDLGGAVLLRWRATSRSVEFHTMLRPNLDDIPDLGAAGLGDRPIPNEPDAIRALIAADNEAFQDHFGAVDDVETSFARSSRPGDGRLLWLVAFEGDEMPARCSTGSGRTTTASRCWLVDSVFTRRPWRQRGLARALIARSLGLLRDRGVASAALGVDAIQPKPGAPAVRVVRLPRSRRARPRTGRPIPACPTREPGGGAAP